MHKSKGASRSDWQTPAWILDLVRQVIGGEIDLDPATNHENPARAKLYYTQGSDGLSMPWVGRSIFLNPPWTRSDSGSLRRWLARAQEVRNNSMELQHMFVIVSAAMNAQWFHDHLADMELYFFPRGRVCYEAPYPNAERYAQPGFDSVLCYYGGCPVRVFSEIFRAKGLVLKGGMIW